MPYSREADDCPRRSRPCRARQKSTKGSSSHSLQPIRSPPVTHSYIGTEPDAVYLPPGRLAAAIRFVLEVAAPAATSRSRSAMVAGSPSDSTRRHDISPIARPYCRSTTSTVASDTSRRRWVIRLSRVRFGASSQKAAKDAPAPVATASIARRSSRRACTASTMTLAPAVSAKAGVVSQQRIGSLIRTWGVRAGGQAGFRVRAEQPLSHDIALEHERTRDAADFRCRQPGDRRLAAPRQAADGDQARRLRLEAGSGKPEIGAGFFARSAVAVGRLRYASAFGGKDMGANGRPTR